MDFRLGCGFGDRHRQMERRGAKHGEFAGEQGHKRLSVGDVDDRGRDGVVLLDLLQLLGAAVGDADAVVAAMGQHARDGGADLAGADDDDVFHFVSPGYEPLSPPLSRGRILI